MNRVTDGWGIGGVPACVRADVLDVVALAVGEVGALAAGVQLAGEVVPQVFPPVVLADGRVRAQSALEHPVDTQHTCIQPGVRCSPVC